MTAVSPLSEQEHLPRALQAELDSPLRLISGASAYRGAVTITAGEGGPAAIVSGGLLIAASMVLAAQVSDRAALIIADTLHRWLIDDQSWAA